MSSALRLFSQDETSPTPAEPITTYVTHMVLNGAPATAIGRTWEEKALRTCGGLCAPEFGCNFTNGHCQIGVELHVPDHLCAAFKRT